MLRLNSILASASVELITPEGTLVIHDARLLRNKSRVIWFSLPTFSVQLGEGKQFEYRPVLEVPAALHRQIAEAVLAAFEQWEPQSAGVRS